MSEQERNSRNQEREQVEGAEQVRDARDTETREANPLVEEWTPPEKLPVPNDRDGYEHRWVRSSSMGKLDNMNVSARLREGWDMCLAKEYPEVSKHVVNDIDGRFSDSGNMEIGGLVLCRMPLALYKSRQKFFDDKSKNILKAADENFMRDSDPRMPKLNPERSTRVTFGKR